MEIKEFGRNIISFNSDRDPIIKLRAAVLCTNHSQLVGYPIPDSRLNLFHKQVPTVGHSISKVNFYLGSDAHY